MLIDWLNLRRMSYEIEQNIKENFFLQITYLHVASEIDYRFSRTKVTSKMVNQKSFSTQAHFDIDLPNEAFITAFKL